MTNYILWAILKNADSKHPLGVKPLNPTSSLVSARKMAMKMIMLNPDYKMIDIQKGKIMGKSAGIVRTYNGRFYWIPNSDAMNGKPLNPDGTVVR